MYTWFAHTLWRKLDKAKGGRTSCRANIRSVWTSRWQKPGAYSTGCPSRGTQSIRIDAGTVCTLKAYHQKKARFTHHLSLSRKYLTYLSAYYEEISYHIWSSCILLGSYKNICQRFISIDAGLAVIVREWIRVGLFLGVIATLTSFG